MRSANARLSSPGLRHRSLQLWPVFHSMLREDCESDGEQVRPSPAKRARGQQGSAEADAGADGGGGRAPGSPTPKKRGRGHCADPAATADGKDVKKVKSVAARSLKHKGGKKKCSACRKQLPLSDFEWDHGRCMLCKRYLDKIYYMCSKQGSLEWLKEQKADDEKLHCLVTNFTDAMNMFDRGESPTKWTLAQYKEELSAASSLVIGDTGMLMNEAKFIEHSQSAEAVERMTAVQAKAAWDKWAADPAATGMFFTGSRQESNLKFRIPLGTRVDFNTTVSLSKRLELVRDKGMKNATSDNVKDMSSKLIGGHSSIGGGALDLHSLASKLLPSGGDGMLNQGVHVPDIRALGMKADVDASEEGEEEKPEEEAMEADNPKSGKKPKWWNKEKAIKDTMHNLGQSVDKVTQEAGTLLNEMNAVKAVIQKLPAEEAEFIKQEIAIFSTKLEGLSLVFGDAPPLDEFIARFKDKVGDGTAAGSAASSAGPGKVAHTMGSAPPCAQYEELKVESILKSISPRCLMAESKEDLDQAKKEVSNALIPWRSLIAACRVAKGDIERRRKSYTEKVEAEAKQRAAALKEDPTTDLIRRASEVFVPLPTVEKDSLDDFDWLRPCILSGFSFKSMPADVQGFVANFKNSTWPKHASRPGAARPRRGCDSLPEDLATQLYGHLKQHAAQGVFNYLDKATSDLKELSAAQIFVINKEVCSLSNEPRFLPSFRWTCLGGSRSIVAADTMELANFFMKARSVPIDKLRQPSQVRSLWKTATLEELRTFAATASYAVQGTIGVDEILFIPAGCQFAEQSHMSEIFGLKVMPIPASARVKQRLEGFADFLESTSVAGAKNHAALKDAAATIEPTEEEQKTLNDEQKEREPEVGNGDKDTEKAEEVNKESEEEQKNLNEQRESESEAPEVGHGDKDTEKAEEAEEANKESEEQKILNEQRAGREGVGGSGGVQRSGDKDTESPRRRRRRGEQELR
jgi:hypothetical protein